LPIANCQLPIVDIEEAPSGPERIFQIGNRQFEIGNV
jgi:hypothetical protein